MGTRRECHYGYIYKSINTEVHKSVMWDLQSFIIMDLPNWIRDLKMDLPRDGSP